MLRSDSTSFVFAEFGYRRVVYESPSLTINNDYREGTWYILSESRFPVDIEDLIVLSFYYGVGVGSSFRLAKSFEQTRSKIHESYELFFSTKVLLNEEQYNGNIRWILQSGCFYPTQIQGRRMNVSVIESFQHRPRYDSIWE